MPLDPIALSSRLKALPPLPDETPPAAFQGAAEKDLPAKPIPAAMVQPGLSARRKRSAMRLSIENSPQSASAQTPASGLSTRSSVASFDNARSFYGSGSGVSSQTSFRSRRLSHFFSISENMDQLTAYFRRLPPALNSRTLATGERLGGGMNGVVYRLLVDDRPSAYVIKKGLIGSETTRDEKAIAWKQELLINQAITELRDKCADDPHAAEALRGIMIAESGVVVDDDIGLLLPHMPGMPADRHLEELAARVAADPSAAPQFVDGLRRALAAPIRGLQLLHDHRIVVNDINVTNIMVDPLSSHAVLHDFGYAGKTGDHCGNGTLSAVPPERILAGNSLAYHDPNHGRPLAPSTDIYALGAMMYRLAHRQTLTWVGLNDHGPATMALISSAEEFQRDQDIYRKLPNDPQHTAPAIHDLQGAAHQAVWRLLRDQGFYDLVKACMNAAPDLRPDAKTILRSQFFAAA